MELPNYVKKLGANLLNLEPQNLQVLLNAPQQFHTHHHLLMDQQNQQKLRLNRQGSQS